MLASYAKSQYEEMQVQTTPEKLIIMLYDGALRFLRLALANMKARDLPNQGLNLSKCQDILHYLDSILNLEAGNIAADLRSLYRYSIRRLLVANAEDREDIVEEVIALLEPLRDGWADAEIAAASERCVKPQSTLMGSAA